MEQKKINIIFATLITIGLLGVLSVAMFGGGEKIITERIVERLAGVTGLDTLELENLVFEAESGVSRLVVDGVHADLPQGGDQIAWTNNTGRAVLVRDLQLSLLGTATSSYRIDIIATTTSVIGDNFDFTNSGSGLLTVTTAGDTFFIRDFGIATSTAFGAVGTTTSAALLQSDLADDSHPTQIVNAGDSVILKLSMISDYTTGDDRVESATSTNRGIEVFMRFFYTSTTTAELGR